jgi:hypothetical protein
MRQCDGDSLSDLGGKAINPIQRIRSTVRAVGTSSIEVDGQGHVAPPRASGFPVRASLQELTSVLARTNGSAELVLIILLNW